MFGKNYDMSKVRIFGCRAFAHIPSALRTKLDPRASEGVYVGHDDASSAYLIYLASTSRTRVVGTPTFIEDVDVYASRLVDSTSVPALPIDPAELFYNKSAPFHDTVDPKIIFDVIGLGAWYSRDDHELVAMVQLQPAVSNSSDCRPARASQPASQGQPEPDCDYFWTTFTRYVSEASPLLPSRFKAVRSVIASWRHHGNLGGFYPLFSTNTVTSRSGGGRGAGADCEAIISAVDTSLMSSNTDMYTVVYDPDMHLQPQDVPTSRIVFANMSTSRLGRCHRTTTRTPNSSKPRTSDVTP
jgi:hypothetical protein